MADKRISQLIERVDIANNDVLPIVASGATTTNKVTISTIQEWMQDNLDVGVTSVGITLGSTGTDVNVTGSPITTSGNITINIPDASTTARGVVTTGSQTFGGVKTFADGLVLASAGGTNQASRFVNTASIHQGSAGSNRIGFNSGNNIYFGKGLDNGGVIQWNNAAVRYYTLQDADGTLAFTSQLDGYVTLNTAQTITAQKVFNTSGSSDSVIITHGSGSGIALDVIKAGDGEAIRVTKTSGSGNAMTISGGNFEAGTIVKTGGTSSQFLKADGSVDSNTYLTTASASAVYVPYTGANSNLDLGQFDLDADTIRVNGSSPTSGSFLGFKHATTVTTGQTDYTSMYTFGTNIIGFKSVSGGTNKDFSFDMSGITANVPGGRVYNLPDASGKLALTSELSDYLPLTGGTLTGALNGTSASFTGAVSATSFNLGNGQFLRLTRTSGGLQYDALGIVAGTDNTRLISTGDFDIVNGSLTSYFKVASTGAATFSSSVTAEGTFFGKGNVVYQNGSTNVLNVGTDELMYGGTNSDGGVFVYGNNKLHLSTNSQRRLTIDGSGLVGIGTASPANLLHLAGSSATPSLRLGSVSAGFHWDIGRENATTGDFVFNQSISGSTTERMRITSGGNVLISNGGQTDGALIVGRNGNNNSILAVSDANNTSEAYFRGFSTSVSASRIIIYSNGNIVNTNNSYGAISDIKLKENIEDASPKLDDLMKVKVRNYNLIGDDKKQIGVIAQELEEVFPAMIDESEDFEEVEVPQVDEEGNEVLNEEGEVVTEKQRVSKGTSTKSVKYSVFVPMLIKAIQEQQEQIDSLKNQIK